MNEKSFKYLKYSLIFNVILLMAAVMTVSSVYFKKQENTDMQKEIEELEKTEEAEEITDTNEEDKYTKSEEDEEIQKYINEFVEAYYCSGMDIAKALKGKCTEDVYNDIVGDNNTKSSVTVYEEDLKKEIFDCSINFNETKEDGSESYMAFVTITSDNGYYDVVYMFVDMLKNDDKWIVSSYSTEESDTPVSSYLWKN